MIAGVADMLRRLIGENIELVTVPARDLGQVRADPGQIEQVLMNLAVNARDAMPTGGRLSIATANVDRDELEARHHASKAGPYVMLAVSDTFWLRHRRDLERGRAGAARARGDRLLGREARRIRRQAGDAGCA